MKPKIIGKEKIEFQSPRSLVRSAKLKFPGRKQTQWEYFEHSEVVVALPIDKQGNIYLVKEWRLAWKKEVLQIPGGLAKGGTEKARIAQIHNELKEEIGMDAKSIKKLTTFYGAANIKYQPHVYLATNLFPALKAPDENEFVQVIKMPFEKAYKLFVEKGEMTTSTTLIAFLLAKQTLSQ